MVEDKYAVVFKVGHKYFFAGNKNPGCRIHFLTGPYGFYEAAIFVKGLDTVVIGIGHPDEFAGDLHIRRVIELALLLSF